MLKILHRHLPDTIRFVTRPSDDSVQMSLKEASIPLLLNALKLECGLLRSDRDSIDRDSKLSSGFERYKPSIWESLLRNMEPGSVELARVVLAGASELIGLEGFDSKQSDLPQLKERYEFNANVESLGKTVAAMLDKICDFEVSTMKALTSEPQVAHHLTSPLFSSESIITESGTSLLKVVGEESFRRDAIAFLLNRWPLETLSGVSNAIRRIADRKAWAPCSLTLKICTDVVDILCNSQDGILRTTSYFAEAEESVRHFWSSLWKMLHVIYKHTQRWSEHIRVVIMTDFCRDVMQFSEYAFNQYPVFESATKSTFTSPAAPVGTTLEQEPEEQQTELLMHPCRTLKAMIM